MYYTPRGEQANTKALYFHYHESHRKNGALKVTGPITAQTADGVYVFSETLSSPTLITVDPTGFLYLEERAPAPLPMFLQTRQILISEDPQDEAAIERVYIKHLGGQAGKGEIAFHTQAPGGPVVDLAPTEFDESVAGFAQLDVRNNVNSFYLTVKTHVPPYYWIALFEPFDAP